MMKTVDDRKPFFNGVPADSSVWQPGEGNLPTGNFLSEGRELAASLVEAGVEGTGWFPLPDGVQRALRLYNCVAAARNWLQIKTGDVTPEEAEKIEAMMEQVITTDLVGCNKKK